MPRMPNESHLHLSVRGDDLKPDHITQLLMTEPSYSFERGDSFPPKRVGSELVEIEQKRAFGVWHFFTAPPIRSPEIEDHAEFFLQQFEPVSYALTQLCKDPDYLVSLTFWYVRSHGFSIDSRLTLRLSKLCESFNIYCWAKEEEEEGE